MKNQNTGNSNSGYWNSGNRNSGDWNSGDWNSGYFNSGNWNSGNRNSGNSNSGNSNSGYWNSGNRNSGFFNTNEPKVRIFNAETDMTMTEFLNTKYYMALMSTPFILTEWVWYSEEEKAADSKKSKIGGYLKEYTYKEACAAWWAKMSADNKATIQTIPNFDKAIFKEITGIKV